MSEKTYYLHDTTRLSVGNCMVWWRKGHHGYTCDINEAHVFTESEIPQYMDRDLVAYPTDLINGASTRHMDLQNVDPEWGRSHL